MTPAAVWSQLAVAQDLAVGIGSPPDHVLPVALQNANEDVIAGMSPDQARAAVQSLIDLAIESSPRHYDGTKNWQNTKKVWAGVRFGHEGLRLTTKRRWREVRQGLQTRYRVSFPGDPNARPPVSAIVRSVIPSNSDAEHPGWDIACDLSTPLDFSARIERWNLGVQIYSIEVKGHLQVRLNMQGRIAAYPDYSVLPPAIVIAPEVTSAELHFDDLHLDRVSKIGGEVAETWGEMVEKVIEEILIDDINEKLHSKLNRAIDKKRDRLRFSAADWMASLTKN